MNGRHVQPRCRWRKTELADLAAVAGTEAAALAINIQCDPGIRAVGGMQVMVGVHGSRRWRFPGNSLMAVLGERRSRDLQAESKQGEKKNKISWAAHVLRLAICYGRATLRRLQG